MKLAVYIGKDNEECRTRVGNLLETLKEAGMELHELSLGEVPSSDTDMLLSVGGD